MASLQRRTSTGEGGNDSSTNTSIDQIITAHNNQMNEIASLTSSKKGASGSTKRPANIFFSAEASLPDTSTIGDVSLLARAQRQASRQSSQNNNNTSLRYGPPPLSSPNLDRLEIGIPSNHHHHHRNSRPNDWGGPPRPSSHRSPSSSHQSSHKKNGGSRGGGGGSRGSGTASGGGGPTRGSSRSSGGASGPRSGNGTQPSRAASRASMSNKSSPSRTTYTSRASATNASTTNASNHGGGGRRRWWVILGALAILTAVVLFILFSSRNPLGGGNEGNNNNSNGDGGANNNNNDASTNNGNDGGNDNNGAPFEDPVEFNPPPSENTAPIFPLFGNDNDNGGSSDNGDQEAEDENEKENENEGDNVDNSNNNNDNDNNGNVNGTGGGGGGGDGDTTGSTNNGSNPFVPQQGGLTSSSSPTVMPSTGVPTRRPTLRPIFAIAFTEEPTMKPTTPTASGGNNNDAGLNDFLASLTSFFSKPTMAPTLPPSSVAVDSTTTPTPPLTPQPTSQPTLPPTSQPTSQPTMAFVSVTNINIALNKPSTASSQGQPSSNAFDANPETRWQSENTNDEYLEVDLGGIFQLSRAIIDWEYAAAQSYEIAVSINGTSYPEDYTVVWSKNDGVAGMGSVTSLLYGPFGRYVRMQGLSKTTDWGYSVWEMAVYGRGPISLGEGNVALNQGAMASSEVSPAMDAFDGDDTTTRWISEVNDNEWLEVDLGSIYQLNSVVIIWEYAAAKSYEIRVSTDGVSYTSLWSKSDGFAGMGAVTSQLGGRFGRFVRMHGIERSMTEYGYSIWEMEVYVEGPDDFDG